MPVAKVTKGTSTMHYFYNRTNSNLYRLVALHCLIRTYCRLIMQRLTLIATILRGILSLLILISNKANQCK